MKILVVSDIHGSVNAIKRLSFLVDEVRPDALFILGDILRGSIDEDGYAVANVIKTLPVLTKLAVRGNCDYQMDEDILGMALPLTRDYRFEKRAIHMSHRPFYLKEYVKGDIYINGHTHQKAVYIEGGAFFLNPGSIALPRDDGASCAVIDEKGLSLLDALDAKILKTLDYPSLDI